MLDSLFKLAVQLIDEDPARAAKRRAVELGQRHLLDRGYTIIERCWRPKPELATVDLVARQGDTIVMVAVEAQCMRAHGEETVAPAPAIAEILETAREFRKGQEQDWEGMRFDRLSVLLDPVQAVRHDTDVIEEAFASMTRVENRSTRS